MQANLPPRAKRACFDRLYALTCYHHKLQEDANAASIDMQAESYSIGNRLHEQLEDTRNNMYEVPKTLKLDSERNEFNRIRSTLLLLKLHIEKIYDLID